MGATWIGGGVPGTLDLLSRSLTPGGVLVVGEPYWRVVPTTPEALTGCGVADAEDYLTLPELLTGEPQQYAAYTRTYFGWGVFALIQR